MSYLQVAEPITLPCGVTVKNRFVKSALSETMATDDHQPTPLFNRLYHTWAQGGAGIVITGNVMVDRSAIAEPGNVVVDDRVDFASLKQWAQAGTANNTQVWLQLNHPGKQSPKMFSKQPVAPSAIPISGPNQRAFNAPRALSTAEVEAIIQKFTNAAVLAQKAGFSGVQIHGAFGYLVNQFLSRRDNQRQDQYGGTLANRMRFLMNIYQGIRAACGNRFPISLKLSLTDINLDGFTEEDFQAVVKTMAALGVDMIEVVGDDYENSQIGFSGMAHLLSQLVATPIAISGGLRHISAMEEALGRRDAQLIGMCTPMAVMPDLPNRILSAAYQPFGLPFTIGNQRLDDRLKSIIVNGYCEAQVKRIAEGKPTKVYTNPWRSVLASVQLHGINGLRTRRIQ